MARYLLGICILIQSATTLAQITKDRPPSWVDAVDIPEYQLTEYEGSYQYVLSDKQDNLIDQTIYRHYAYVIKNNEGVQTMSDLNINYDPSYEVLRWHKIDVIRSGEIIDKMKNSEVKTLQRETSLERSLYDGSLSAVINLSDIRVGDLVEYAYSIEGFNPVNKGNYSNSYYFELSIPINKIRVKIITNKKRDIEYRLFEGANEPDIKTNDDEVIYNWSEDGTSYVLYDNNVPAWFNSQKRVYISTYKNWKQVVEWAAELYKYDLEDIKEIEDQINYSDSIEQKILEYIRLVQDDVRYLGFESGIGAYKPHSPKKVFNQKYGDCKDKSLLLVSLLRNIGIQAYPLLVNTQLKEQIKSRLPSANMFDHCVVKFDYNEHEYFIDPTISNQGGKLGNIYFPDYRNGLLIKEGEQNLIDIPLNVKSSITISEVIHVDSIGGRADYTVRTEYTGSRADNIRGYFNTTPKETITKDYMDYYSGLYASIQRAGGIEFLDNERGSSNKVVVEEYYSIEKFWEESNNGTSIYCEIYPIVLESETKYTKSASRTMPYYLGTPFYFSQNTVINLPEDWSVEKSSTTIDGIGFQYTNSISGKGKSVSVSHSYDLKQSHIPADTVDQFLKKHGDIKNELSYYLTYDHSLTGFKLSWVSVTIAIVAIFLGIVFAIKIYRNYNPIPWELANDNSIGGWLVFPAFGLTLTPIYVMYQVISDDFFNHNNWLAYYNGEYDNLIGIFLLYGAEIAYNFFYLVFSVLIVILFYQRRSSVPRLVSIFYAVSFLFPILDSLCVELLIPDNLSDADNADTLKQTFRAFVRAAIWIPYFNISDRSKNTFCKQY